MPVCKLEKLSGYGAWGLWRIDEQIDDLWAQLHKPDSYRDEFKQIRHPQKQREWLASRLLIQRLLPLFDLLPSHIYKDQHGKPHLHQSQWSISIAHCFPLAAGALNKDGPIGIDIEKPKEKLLKIASRFLSEEEMHHAGNRVETLCIYWTGKEVLYKIYGRKKLIFKENMRLEPQMDKPLHYRGSIRIAQNRRDYDIFLEKYHGHFVAYSREMAD